MKFKKALAAFAAVAVTAAVAYAANIPLITGPQDPSQLNASLNNLINQINTGITQTTIAQFNSNDRNILDNGTLEITQRGTGVITCAANAGITSAAYGADRWGCQANVAVGAGRQQVITATPTPPAGFKNAMTLFRTSGVLTQPICTWQEIPTADVLKLSGQQVLFSAYLQALAGMAADNGSIANLVIITGTGTDEGFGTPTASPAITPAWTGIATLANTATPALSATAWSRPIATGVVASTVTEMAVGLCFTPTATGAGATDGFAWTGAQLEVVGAGVTTPSTFSFKAAAYELRQAQRYFYRISEGAAATFRGNGHVTTAGAGDANGKLQWQIIFPMTMFKVPTMTYTAGFAGFTTTGETAATACSALATDATLGTIAASTQMVPVQCSLTSSTIAVGLSMSIVDNGGSGVVNASADF